MENILIINLRKFGDILSSAHLIHSLKNSYPESNISLLVYREYFKAAKLIKHLSKIHIIDRKKIAQFKKNRLYSKSFAINLLKETLDEITSTSWDHVINFSHEPLSCILTTYISQKNYIGLKYTPSMQVNYSSSWSLFFNDVMTEYPFTPIHFNECYHKMANINYTTDEIKIITDPNHNKMAYDNFKKIKERFEKKEKIKIVGIQLRSGVAEKEIPFDTLINLVQELIDHQYFYPVLIISPDQEDIERANQINKFFDNSILSIEADLSAVPSVLINLDLLITPDTSIKHLADLVSTPIVEVSRGPSPFRKQGAINQGNLILRENSGTISSTDIINAVLYYFHYYQAQDITLQNGIVLYENRQIEESFYYRPIAGKFDIPYEISCLLSKYYTLKLFSDIQSEDLLKEILLFATKDNIYQWVQSEKESMSKLVKNLLATIKSLRELKVKGTYQNQFVQELEHLLENCNEKSLTAIPALLFRGKLESLEKSSFEQNIKDLEKLLFELKNNLQLMTTVITNLTSMEFKLRKRGEEKGVASL